MPMMDLGRLLCAFLAFLLQSTSCLHVPKNELSCATDYSETVTCSFKHPLAIVTENRFYYVEIQRYDEYMFNESIRCPPQKDPGVYRCSVSDMTNDEFFEIKLCYEESGNVNSSVLISDFSPAKSIKPKVPFDLMLEYANGEYNFTWKSGYEHHRYKNILPFIYEFLYYKDGEINQTSIVTVFKSKTIKAVEKQLSPDTKYLAMVRTKIQNNKYNGTWSDWSKASAWKTKHQDDPDLKKKIQFDDEIVKILSGLCLIFGLPILLILIPAVRLKLKQLARVPTPETYFKPLYHQGHFQGWGFTKIQLQDGHVKEDFSTIDKISQIITQQDEEKTDKPFSAQSPGPYVGPTTEPWAFCQASEKWSVPRIPPEEEFPLFSEELPDREPQKLLLKEVCLSDDVSFKSSGFSLESLEICEAIKPQALQPKPLIFKQDYCTLTNSSCPVPTFSKQPELDQNTDINN